MGRKMSTNPHPHVQLSAYLDGALAPAERAAVDGHLASCADCRARLSELRAIASLIAALPPLAPSRRLVPRVATIPAWLAPLRTLTTLASGVAAFLFVASALLTNIGSLATGTAGLPAAAPAGGATSAERGAASPSALNQASAPSADTAKAAASPTPSSPGAQFSTSSAAPQDAAARADQSAPREAVRSASPLAGTSPWLWLALAVILGAIALALQRRLRSA
jgi:anti-sigma factor RsiW